MPIESERFIFAKQGVEMVNSENNNSAGPARLLVVGCGNIGSRLLQSLANVSSETCGHLDIHGLEPFEAARETAKSRFDEVNQSGHALTLHADISDAPKAFDLLVISVDARNRLAALSTALGHAKVKSAVLEKTLFVRESEFEKARALLLAGNVKTWVNTSRNVWPGYEWLKSEVAAHGPITGFKVSGSDWNMASNAIHFMAALEYISGYAVQELALKSDTVEVREAKRAGYREVTGVMSGALEDGTVFELASLRNTGLPVDVTVNIGERIYNISEGPQSVTVHPSHETKTFGMLHASQLEHMFESILTHGTCGLPSYDQSRALHQRLFNCLEDYLGQRNDGELVLPIT